MEENGQVDAQRLFKGLNVLMDQYAKIPISNDYIYIGGKIGGLLEVAAACGAYSQEEFDQLTNRFYGITQLRSMEKDIKKELNTLEGNQDIQVKDSVHPKVQRSKPGWRHKVLLAFVWFEGAILKILIKAGIIEVYPFPHETSNRNKKS